jgi:hypothetical protein
MARHTPATPNRRRPGPIVRNKTVASVSSSG